MAGFGPARAADTFGAFISELRPVCARGAASDCVDAVNRFLDADANGRIELGELEGVRGLAYRAVQNKSSGLNVIERNLTAVALMVMKYAGLPQVFGNFDTDGDGALSKAELFADFRIDHRPFAKIVKDPRAVDWKSFAGRFGKVGYLITDLLPPSHRR